MIVDRIERCKKSIASLERSTKNNPRLKKKLDRLRRLIIKGLSQLLRLVELIERGIEELKRDTRPRR